MRTKEITKVATIHPPAIMAKEGYHDHPADEPEDCGNVLEAFHEFGVATRPPAASRRHSTGSRPVNFSENMRSKERSRRSSSRGGSSKRLSRDSTGQSSRSALSKSKSLGSNRTATSTDSDEEEDDDDFPDSQAKTSAMSVRNRALIHENRRLQELIVEYEKHLKKADLEVGGSNHTSKITNTNDFAHIPADEDEDHNSEESVSRLKGKIRSLKHKRKQEKLTLMQMQKNVDAHSAEIEGLQRELSRTVTKLEKEQKGRQEDKRNFNILSKQLVEARNQLNKNAGDNELFEKLKCDLNKRDGELEVTLKLLQEKVERIMALEIEVEKYKEKVTMADRRIEDLTKNGGDGKSFSNMELISAEAEIKSVRRQNMMLKLVVEELQEARKRRSDSDIDIDSVFLKLPPEIQQEIPFSVGLGALSLGGVTGEADDRSVETDMISFETIPRPDPKHPLRR